MHLTWWVHPDDPTWYNEVSFWASKEPLTDWHMNIYHKNAKEWAARSRAPAYCGSVRAVERARTSRLI
jgi:hypothetical protein